MSNAKRTEPSWSVLRNPERYMRSESTDIRILFNRIRAEAKPADVPNVSPMRRRNSSAKGL